MQLVGHCMCPLSLIPKTDMQIMNLPANSVYRFATFSPGGFDSRVSL